MSALLSKGEAQAGSGADGSSPVAGQPAASGAAATHLALMIGDERYLVDLADAGEIVPMPAASILQVPLTRDWFLGVVNVRGTLFTVVDLARFMGGGFTPLSKESRLLTLSPALTFNATLVVSRMLGLRNSAAMTLLEKKVSYDKPWLAEQYSDAEGQVWRRLSLSKLVSASEFLMVGR
ncbi:MAG: chemotaxis protein CheW [Lautropia sp.]|nr:chemotaxis protein CheW [Lautropia sp.]